MQTGLVFNIQRYSLQDGPGIRTTVFLKGCPLRCWWCHNPESQSAQAEIVFLESRCTRCGECRTACPQTGVDATNTTCLLCGACVAACPSEARQLAGGRMTVDQVLAEVLKDRIFYDDSGGGVTFSGGEPLAQPEFLRELLAACRAQGIHTAVDTSGYAPREQILATASLVDLFLYDVKLMDDARHRQFTGVSNTLILENLEMLGRSHRAIWVRVPVVPGSNDDGPQLEAVARFAASLPGVVQMHLLAYHKTGLHKWDSLAKPRPPESASSPSAEAMQRAAERLRALGLRLPIHIGG